jgi:predicted nucleotide-binding protein
MHRLEIPSSVIATVSEVLSQYYNSHTKLNTLFMESGAPGDPPDGNCITKCNLWLKRCNIDTTVDPLTVLGNVIQQLMDRDAPGKEQERIQTALEKNGLNYELNGRIRNRKHRGEPDTMKKSLLMSTQKTQVMNAIQEQEIDSSEFSWAENSQERVPMVADEGIISVLVHVPTGYSFSFDLRREHFWASFSPGNESPDESKSCNSWPEMLALVRYWLSCLKRELQATAQATTAVPASPQLDERQPKIPLIHRRNITISVPEQSHKALEAKDPAVVAVVHGRNERVRAAMFTFLRALQLKPIEFSQAIHLTGEGSPYVGTALEVLFANSQAVVVLLTGDEEVRLREQFLDPAKPEEATLDFQSRPNVLFEAGLAMGSRSKQTILVQLGKHREFSDIGGRHVLRFCGTPQDRNNLASRLEAAGCPVDRKGTDWLGVGDFEAALEVTGSDQSKGDLMIVEALYGVRDHRINVADRLTSLIRNDKLHVYVGNQLVDNKDPFPSTRKDIKVRYIYRNIEHAITVLERDDLTLPTESDVLSHP